MTADRSRMLGSIALCIGMVLTCGFASHLTPAADLVAVISSYALLWGGAVVLFFLFPRACSPRQAVVLFVLTSVLCRLAMLPHVPSDDVNRYLWEGRVLMAGFSPYAHAPNAPLLAELASSDPYHAFVNHPDMAALYPPLMIELFGVMSSVWYSPTAIKLVVGLFDLVAVLFILALLRERHLPLRWAILYALNPLVLLGFAGEGHFDSIQAAFLTGALLCHARKKWVLAFLMAGLAVQVKYVGVLAIPFLINRHNWRYAWVAAAAAMVPYLPIFLLDSRLLFHSVMAFGSDFAFNGPIHGVLRAATGSMHVATSIVRVMFLAALGFAALFLLPLSPRSRNRDPLPGVVFVFGMLLLLSPTIHYWYLGWILPFVVILPSWGWLLASLTCVAYFTVCRTFALTGVWALSQTALLVEWLPVLALLTWEGVAGWRRLLCGSVSEVPENISVIVPVINEEQRIAACCDALRASPLVSEILVSDCGSTDGTVAAAEDAGATVVVCESGHDGHFPGRGGQIAAALERASGDVVAIVHADTHVPAESWPRIIGVLRENPGIVGGSLGCTFRGGTLGIRLVELLNDIRATCMSLSFGDQVQFFRRQAVVERSLFPNMPLMEDVEFSLRLPRIGRTVHLFGLARVSLRGWETYKCARALFIIRLVVTYLARRIFGQVDTREMYARYYGK